MCASQFCDVMNCFSRKKFSDLAILTSKLDSRVPLLQLRGMCYRRVCHLDVQVIVPEAICCCHFVVAMAMAVMGDVCTKYHGHTQA